ncbi:MAG: SPOR domain-containing protein [Lautropia sp.]|nr:SPOR domain-containing protein [Lautropia sp.]
MSRHKSRITSDGAADASLIEKKKARHRLVGAAALCLVAAIVVPLMLESEPRNAARNLPLTIAADPASVKGQPAWTDTSPSAEAPAEPGSQTLDRLVMLEERVPAAPPPAPQTSTPTRESVFSSGAQRGNDAAAVSQQPGQRPASPTSASPAAGRTPEPIRPPVPGRQPAPAPAERPDVLARLIDQVDSPKPGAARPERQARRFLVQVGAYSNVKSARLASDRVSKAGMTAYHETVKTANGDWIRVRIGPFESREEAEQAQKTLKRAGVTAALIAL